MIVPQVSELEWGAVLAPLPEWAPYPQRTVVVVPHPDDETLAVGGLIAKLIADGVDVTVLAVTDGENAYADAVGLGEVRRVEQERALARLGLQSNKIVRLTLPDSAVAAHESVLIACLRSRVSRDTQIIAPWSGDFHPDHEACGRAAESVAAETGATLISYFFWTWHRGTADCVRQLRLRRLPLDAALLRAKTEALQEHRSQLQHESGEPILPTNLLAPARRSYEVIALQ